MGFEPESAQYQPSALPTSQRLLKTIPFNPPSPPSTMGGCPWQRNNSSKYTIGSQLKTGTSACMKSTIRNRRAFIVIVTGNATRSRVLFPAYLPAISTSKELRHFHSSKPKEESKGSVATTFLQAPIRGLSLSGQENDINARSFPRSLLSNTSALLPRPDMSSDSSLAPAAAAACKAPKQCVCAT